MGRVEYRDGEPLLRFFIQDPTTGTLYRRGPLLGKGAFGRCYQLTNMSTHEVFAVKVISRQDHPGKVEHEIELHSQLCHPHVVAFHGHFADRENIYLVLEYCSRKSLAHILKVRKRLTEPEGRFYLRQVVAGLQYLHLKGILHRDLKLSNLFVTKDMKVKIGDFGLAIQGAEEAGRRPGAVCGTPNYLAPEVIAKQGHSVQSDVWALGCTLYTALTGHSPFEVTHRPEMYRRIQGGHYPLPSHLSANARQLIGRLLDPRPDARPSLEEVLEHPFFTQGFTPDRLPPAACRRAPSFFFSTFPDRLRRFFRKATGFLFRGGPCGGPKMGSPEPQEAAAVAEGTVSPKEVPLASETTKKDPATEDPGLFPLPLLRRGSLKAGWSGKGERSSPGGVMEALEQTLQTCLETVPMAPEPLPPCDPPWGPPSLPPARMVTKWVDYSNKYGFGYLLSDGATGVLLPDGTHMAFCPQRQRFSYCGAAPQVSSFPPREVPLSLKAKVGVLKAFSRYMHQRLQEGSPQLTRGRRTSSSSPSSGPLVLLHFAKSDEALLMAFSDGTLQVNFYHDRSKIVLSQAVGGKPCLAFVGGRHGASSADTGVASLEALARHGWTLPLRDRVAYALHMLRSL